MNGLTNEDVLSEEEAIKEQLDDLKSSVAKLHNDIKCLKQCSRLSNQTKLQTRNRQLTS